VRSPWDQWLSASQDDGVLVEGHPWLVMVAMKGVIEVPRLAMIGGVMIGKHLDPGCGRGKPGAQSGGEDQSGQGAPFRAHHPAILGEKVPRRKCVSRALQERALRMLWVIPALVASPKGVVR
jgi:hypothetical protein